MDEPKLLSSKHRQIKALRAMCEYLTEQFTNKRNNKDSTWFSKYKLDDSLAEYEVGVWLRGERHGISLVGPPIVQSRFLLTCRTYPLPQKGANAAVLAEDKRGVALYHDGRVYAGDGRDRPWMPAEQTTIGGRSYYKIEYLENANFIKKLLQYHFSRTNPNLALPPKKTVPKSRHNGSDPGPQKGGVRSQATFSAKHHPITKALERVVKDHGYEIQPCAGAHPDLLAKKGDDSILFEIKPEPTTHDLITACGQVLVYNESAKANRTYIVSKPIQWSKADGISIVMKRNRISYLPYVVNGDDHSFIGIDDIL